MTYYKIFDPALTEPSEFQRFPSRESILKSIDSKSRFDCVIVGGGIHGACLARLAAYNGLKVLLLEKNDYGWATSSRSSKMAHGGLRYLETFDFRQVFEGIRARDDLFKVAPHLVKPEKFLFPVTSLFQRLKVELGLTLYDLFLKNKSLKHRWKRLDDLPENSQKLFQQNVIGCFHYSDGLLNDVRLVAEQILAARQEGAICLNYARFDASRHEKTNDINLSFTDLITGAQTECRAGIIVNCAGPWADKIGRLSSAIRVRFSQGIHIVFDTPWNGPSLIVPMKKKGRYYFVWPHECGTLVGTTEKELDLLPEDPEPTPEEVIDLLRQVSEDLPLAGLTSEKAIYAYAGVRTLAARTTGDTSKLSRRHEWNYSQGILTLIGGKLTTAMWTAIEGLERVFELAERPGHVQSLKGSKLPGGWINTDVIEKFKERGKNQGVSTELLGRAISLLGSRVEILLNDDSLMRPISNITLLGQIRVAIEIEQAETAEDICRRRLCIEPYLMNDPDSYDELFRIIDDALQERGRATEGSAGYKKNLIERRRVLPKWN